MEFHLIKKDKDLIIIHLAVSANAKANNIINLLLCKHTS